MYGRDRAARRLREGKRRKREREKEKDARTVGERDEQNGGKDRVCHIERKREREREGERERERKKDGGDVRERRWMHGTGRRRRGAGNESERERKREGEGEREEEVYITRSESRGAASCSQRTGSVGLPTTRRVAHLLLVYTQARTLVPVGECQRRYC
jgi:hypothetical protein